VDAVFGLKVDPGFVLAGVLAARLQAAFLPLPIEFSLSLIGLSFQALDLRLVASWGGSSGNLRPELLEFYAMLKVRFVQSLYPPGTKS